MADAVYRALKQYEELALIVAEIDNLSTEKTHTLTEKLDRLFKENASNCNWQAAANLGTAALCLIAIPALARFGIDSATAGIIGTKTGEVFNKALEGLGTKGQGDIKVIENKLGQGPSKSHKELLEHFSRSTTGWVETNGRILAGG